MTEVSYAWSDDVGSWSLLALAGVVLVASALLVAEVVRRRERAWWVLATGLLALTLSSVAVLRPITVVLEGATYGASVVVLADGSDRLALPAGERESRRARRARVLEGLRQRFGGGRLEVREFDEAGSWPAGAPAKGQRTGSDLVRAWRDTVAGAQSPSAVVVVSDGRLDFPGDGDAATMRRALKSIRVPVHTVRLTQWAPPDASIRSVRAVGAAVAHEPVSIEVEVACSGGLACDDVQLTFAELQRESAPRVLAEVQAELEQGRGVARATVTLERAGPRIVEIRLGRVPGDTIEQNNARWVTLDVARERLRLLHVAGRPTYDVRALRMWLKGDPAIDLISFFILRSKTDDTRTQDDSELALIPFPVHELFSQHLPSFDVVVLQDIDAVEYELSVHLPALARYVENGGGLVAVGGPHSFSGGRYAGTALVRVLPVDLQPAQRPYDTRPFVPVYSSAGRAAPLLGPLRDILGARLPRMTGASFLGKAREGAFVLWEHPLIRVTPGDTAMPVLAASQAGDGRSIALAVDATHQLAFGELAANFDGTPYGALWDGILGWLMRDPRYEPARARVDGECREGRESSLLIERTAELQGDTRVVLRPMGAGAVPVELPRPTVDSGGAERVTLGQLAAGGYSAEITIGAAPAARYDFACERGGRALADSRPDPSRLKRISAVTDGLSVDPSRVQELPIPQSRNVAHLRRTRPVAPHWLWTTLAAAMLGLHWWARRATGLA